MLYIKQTQDPLEAISKLDALCIVSQTQVTENFVSASTSEQFGNRDSQNDLSFEDKEILYDLYNGFGTKSRDNSFTSSNSGNYSRTSLDFSGYVQQSLDEKQKKRREFEETWNTDIN